MDNLRKDLPETEAFLKFGFPIFNAGTVGTEKGVKIKAAGFFQTGSISAVIFVVVGQDNPVNWMSFYEFDNFFLHVLQSSVDADAVHNIKMDRHEWPTNRCPAQFIGLNFSEDFFL